MTTTYALVSLPITAFDTGSKEEAAASVKETIGQIGNAVAFRIPDFKIGTLDGLVQQADDLAKLEANCHNVVTKVADSLRSILGGDAERLTSYKMVNDSALLRLALVNY